MTVSASGPPPVADMSRTDTRPVCSWSQSGTGDSLVSRRLFLARLIVAAPWDGLGLARDDFPSNEGFNRPLA